MSLEREEKDSELEMANFWHGDFEVPYQNARSERGRGRGGIGGGGRGQYSQGQPSYSHSQNVGGSGSGRGGRGYGGGAGGGGGGVYGSGGVGENTSGDGGRTAIRDLVPHQPNTVSPFSLSLSLSLSLSHTHTHTHTPKLLLFLFPATTTLSCPSKVIVGIVITKQAIHSFADKKSESFSIININTFYIYTLLYRMYTIYIYILQILSYALRFC